MELELTLTFGGLAKWPSLWGDEATVTLAGFRVADKLDEDEFDDREERDEDWLLVDCCLKFIFCGKLAFDLDKLKVFDLTGFGIGILLVVVLVVVVVGGTTWVGFCRNDLCSAR